MAKSDLISVSEMIGSLKRKPIIGRILEELKADLSPEFRFHSVAHTEDVLEETVLFAQRDGRTERELELLAIAAAFHDSGFLNRPENHEERGAERAEAAMREDGTYSESEISLVRRMILDTKLVETSHGVRQNPQAELSGYLLDGDLSNFGRDDFFDRLEARVQEIAADKLDLARITLQLMIRHRWLTEAASSLRDKKKQENIESLRKMIEKSESNQ